MQRVTLNSPFCSSHDILFSYIILTLGQTFVQVTLITVWSSEAFVQVQRLIIIQVRYYMYRYG